MRRRVVPVLLLSLSACPAGPKIIPAWDPVTNVVAPDDAASPAAEPAAPRSAQAEAMHGWLLELGRLRDTTAAGDLASLRDEAERWAAGLNHDAGDDWRVSIGEIRREARVLARATSLPDAAASVARLAGACGACHEAQHVVQRVERGMPVDADPPQGGNFRDEMHQHRWASTRMWEGLVAPSVPRWIRGTTMFMILPDCPHDDGTDGSAQGDRCHHARSLARRARLAEATEGRVSLYGRLLSTCGECHTSSQSPGEPGLRKGARQSSPAVAD